MKQFKALSKRWLIIAMLFHVELVSVCVWPQKTRMKSKKFPHESQNRVEHVGVFSQLFVNKDASVYNSSFYRKNTGLVR